MPAQVIEDEDYQLRYERVAGIDVAKESAVVCARMPPARDGSKHRTSDREVPGDGPGESGARGRLTGRRGQMVSMEATCDYVRSEGA